MFSTELGGFARLRPSKPPMALSSFSAVGCAGVPGMWRFDQQGCRNVIAAPPGAGATEATSQRGSVQKPLPCENTNSTFEGLRQASTLVSCVKYPESVWTHAWRPVLVRGARRPFTYSSRLTVPLGTDAVHTPPGWGVHPVTGRPPDSTGWAPSAFRYSTR